jgi:gliding motility-associated-like protein
MADRIRTHGLAIKPKPALHFIVVLLLGMPAFSTNAQVHWLDKFDGAAACHIVDVAVDAAGNAYVIGDLSSTTTVASAGVVLTTIPTAGGPDVLVAKFAPNGSLIWAHHAGGAAVDLGLKLALGPAGLAVTGVFTGSADLFGTNVTAEGGSTDLFVALLNGTDGQAQWVRTAGSPGYTDTPGGITMNSAGDIIVVGKFKGDAVFAAETLHSAINPFTALPSFDVFIAAWSATGSLQWVKQGTGSKDCTAVDIVSGPDDQLYVTGQFSDTITFDVMHPGTVLNGLYLLNIDPQGNEQWFRRSGGGSFNQVSDLRWSSANDLLLTGDVSGTMHWSDGTTSTPISNPFPYAYFILRASPSGDLLDNATMGSTSGVHAASITEQSDSVVVLGEFECSFTGLQVAYGADGLFIAMGSPDLFIAKHAAADLSFVQAQQFGGSAATDAGAIADTPDGLLFSGAFTSLLFLPRGSTAWGDPIGPCSFLSANGGLNFCDDPNYGKLAWASGTGLATGFLTKGFVEGRQPFDFWDRSGVLQCDRGALDDGVQITFHDVIAPDTVTICSATSLLGSVVPFPRGTELLCSITTPTAGPFSHQLWSTGSGLEYTGLSSSGWVSFTVSSGSGCLSWTDSVFVNYTPLIASVSDSSGAYQNVELPIQGPIVSCGPMVFWVEQMGSMDQAYWINGSDTTFSDTVHIPASGIYVLQVNSSSGCSNQFPLVFEIVDPLNITGVTSQLTGSDTIQTCNANCITGHFTNTWYVDGVETQMPLGYLVSYHSTGGCDQIGITDAYQPIPWGLELNGTGWYTVHSEVVLMNGDCATDPYTFIFTDSVYVEVGDEPSVTFTSFVVPRCVDDTVMIPFTCSNCDTVIWNGPGIVWISPNADTVLVDQNGTYSAIPVSLSNNFPCAGEYQTVVVSGPVPPSLFMEPANGTVCPNELVLLSTDAVGADYIWTGPGTAFLPHSNSIWVDEPGDYYLTVMLYPGCSVSNGPATISFFGSPLISGLPAGLLCPGESVSLQIEVEPGGTVQWQPPLSGNALVQTVSAPGTYSCIVSSCGNDWNLSYDVVYSSVSADLGADTFALCQDLPITLTAPGASAYLWLPSGATGQQLVVTTPGTYELIATDAAGCSVSSGPIAVIPQSIAQPASAAGDSICAGQVVTLTGSGSGDLFWYASPDTTELLAEGAVLTYLPLTTDTLFLLQVENGCPGEPVPVVVFVQEVPAAPVINGNDAYCTGDMLLLVADGASGAIFNWSTPWGVFQGDSIGPTVADAMHDGTYACTVVLNGCASDTAYTSIVVFDAPQTPVITGEEEVCVGDTLFLFAAGTTGSVFLWSTPSGPYSGSQLVIPDVNTENGGAYLCHAVLGDCAGDTAIWLTYVISCDAPDPVTETPNVITPNGDGVNDVFQFAGPGFKQAELRVFNRWGQQVAVVAGRNASWDGRNAFSGELLSEGVYFYIIEAVTVAGEPFHKAGYVHLLR